jgi:type I restriction enzyme, R subunit
MSERVHVEAPFLQQLRDLEWTVIDQGEGVPGDPTASLRASFREVGLRQVFVDTVRSLNRLPDGRQWLTVAQAEELFEHFTNGAQQGGNMVAINQSLTEELRTGQTHVKFNKLTAELHPKVVVIDFEDPTANAFHAINQFRVDTPGRVKDHIRPDIVLFVNGLPLVVVECKDANAFTSDPIHESIKQLRRYSNQREKTAAAGLSEGDERLFHTNQLLIGTCGTKAVYGSLTSTEKYFYEWKTIYPDRYRLYTPPLGQERSQERLIQGMLAREILLDIVRHFVMFVSDSKLVKIVPRYQQYRAVGRVVQRLRAGKTPEERSGVVWHTQGSGKSFTMVFLVRKLRTTEELKDYKVVMVNDRTDLEEQLGETAALAGEKVRFVDSAKALQKYLASTASDLNMVMVHKFLDRADRGLTQALKQALGSGEAAPRFAPFGVVNNSSRILLLIDEAHRTQNSDLGNNLFAAFPQAARVAFTGTPIEKTAQRFGTTIDTYKLHDAVADGATVKLLYEGKTADVAIKEKAVFDSQFADLCKDLDDDVRETLALRYGSQDSLWEAEKRIEEIADDLVKHYLARVFPDGFKAQVVATSKLAAVRYCKAISNALDKTASSIEKDADMLDGDARTRALAYLQRLRKLKAAVVVSSDNVNEEAAITTARKLTKEWNAVENFQRNFDDAEPLSYIGFLVVCDMLLTGFDAPIVQVMYLDKKMSGHNLLQAIARANRVKEGKAYGLIVDYCGVGRSLREALAKYSSEDQDDVAAAMHDLAEEIPVLTDRYAKVLAFFRDRNVPQADDWCAQRINDLEDDYIVKELMVDTGEPENDRATLEVLFTQFFEQLNTVLPHSAGAPYIVPAKRLGYLQAQIRERYKDETISVTAIGEKVRDLINVHLVSLGINPKVPPVELLSAAFEMHVGEHRSNRAKASEMEHAIRKHCTVHLDEDPEFFKSMAERLQKILDKHRNDWDTLASELSVLTGVLKKGRTDLVEGVAPKAMPFYDRILAVGYPSIDPVMVADKERGIAGSLANGLLATLKQHLSVPGFWENEPLIKALRGDIKDMLLESDSDALFKHREAIASALMDLARHRRSDLLG